MNLFADSFRSGWRSWPNVPQQLGSVVLGCREGEVRTAEAVLGSLLLVRLPLFARGRRLFLSPLTASGIAWMKKNDEPVMPHPYFTPECIYIYI